MVKENLNFFFFFPASTYNPITGEDYPEDYGKVGVNL